jgi:GT2 family glycosyltransferase
MKQSDVAVVVINWNGEQDSLECIASLKKQSLSHTVLAVDNGSTDNFAKKITESHEDVVLLKNERNLGFSGGANIGMRYAIDHNFKYVALINNDARPDKNWLKNLTKTMTEDESAGIVTCKLLKLDGSFDSTGDQYTIWGLAYPRGRDTLDNGQFQKKEYVFAASGGASLYRVKMLQDVGIFDNDFFAYFEDVDLSFRAQLRGWKIVYQPEAIAHHQVGGTSGKIKGFTTYQTLKNLPFIVVKNVPARLLFQVVPRFMIAYWSIFFSSLKQGKAKSAIKGLFMATILTPKKLLQRFSIQHKTIVDPAYIRSIIVPDLPPNAHKLRRLRAIFLSK